MLKIKDSVDLNEVNDLSLLLLQAINKQVEELRWYNDY